MAQPPRPRYATASAQRTAPPSCWRTMHHAACAPPCRVLTQRCGAPSPPHAPSLTLACPPALGRARRSRACTLHAIYPPTARLGLYTTTAWHAMRRSRRPPLVWRLRAYSAPTTFLPPSSLPSTLSPPPAARQPSSQGAKPRLPSCATACVQSVPFQMIRHPSKASLSK